jgi:hypothetical protein
LLQPPKSERLQVLESLTLFFFYLFKIFILLMRRLSLSSGVKSFAELPLVSDTEASHASSGEMDLQVVVAASSVSTAVVDSTVITVSQGDRSVLSPVDNLREGLIQSTVDQFFMTLDHCIQLIMFNGQPFSLLQPLLDHIIESIRRLGGTHEQSPSPQEFWHWSKELQI